jgi:cold shock CspA family protein
MSSKRKRGWLKTNHFKDRGFGILECDDDRKEVFCHISAFRCAVNAVYDLEYRTRLALNLTTDPRRPVRTLATDVEVIDAQGNAIEMPARLTMSSPFPEQDNAGLMRFLQPSARGMAA